MPDLPKIQRDKLSNKVYSILKDMIVDYRFNPGSRINIEEMSKQLGVSRTPVWEAIAKLEREGLVQNVPNRGVFMAVLSAEDALDLYAVRSVLEGMAARLAADRMDDITLQKMQKCLEKQGPVCEKQDVIAYSRLDFEFHGAVYDACGNSFLKDVLTLIKNKMRPINMHIQPILPLLYNDHIKLLQALKTHNAEDAERILVEHNRCVMGHIREELEAGRWGKAGTVDIQTVQLV